MKEAFNGLFDFSIASKAPSSEILLQSWKQMKITWCEIRTVYRRFQPTAAILFCIAVTECGLALSSNNRTSYLRSPGHFFRNALFNFGRVPQNHVTLMVPTSIKARQKLTSSIYKALNFLGGGLFEAYQMI
ncbi:hypothetical protein TNCV_2221891 [Trichonephila clavipes]|nr:hypothetical protein TNCV_2221891 [Trichonephila clavipes]